MADGSSEGELEGVVDLLGKPWDLAPAVLLVEEAGGSFEDRDRGRRIDLGQGWFTNGSIADELREALSRL